jgi:hypothetical protein
MTTFSCTTPPRLSIVYSSICIRISIVQDLSGFAACYGGRCVVCVQVGSILFLLTTWHSRPSSSGKLLKTARRNTGQLPSLPILGHTASPNPNTNKGEKPKPKEGRNGRKPRNRPIPGALHLQFSSACHDQLALHFLNYVNSSFVVMQEII